MAMIFGVLAFGVLAYVAIGVVIGLGRLSKGIYGQRGPVVTLIAWGLVWPLTLIFENRFRD
jgi:hypothetical protein